jgi:hypothetical protein
MRKFGFEEVLTGNLHSRNNHRRNNKVIGYKKEEK